MSVLNLEISNTDPGSYSTATTIDFPADDEKLHRKLYKAQITDARNGAKNDIVYCKYSWLRSHIRHEADLYKVNLLTHRIQNHIPNVSIGDIHISPDFQTDLTGDYPTSLVWDMANGTVILQLSPAFDDDSEQANQCKRDCADWGVHPCTSMEDYNDLLESIGDKVYEIAAVQLDGDVEFGMGGIS